MAPDESTNKVKVEDLPARQSPGRAPEVSLSVGLIFQLVAIGIFLAGSGLLFAMLTGHRRLIRSLGIEIRAAPEVALLLIGLGVLILFRQSFQTPTRNASPEPAKMKVRKKRAEPKPRPPEAA